MPDENIVFKNIEKLGERYRKEILLKDWKKDEYGILHLESDWWEGLKFFFSHSFFRGRRDKLSEEYYCFTKKALTEHFQITLGNLDDSYQRIRAAKEQFNSNIYPDESAKEFYNKIRGGLQ